MTPPPAERETTPAGSSSPKSSQSQSATTTPAGVTAPVLGVRRTTPSTSTSMERDGLPNGGAAGAGEPPSDPLDSPTSTRSESDEAPEPGGEQQPLRLKKRPLADVLRGLVIGAGVAIHQALARNPYEIEAGVWLIDESEAAGVADPLANIANRHAGDTLVNPDAGDLIAAGVAAASYVISNAVKAFQIRRALRRAGMHTEPEDKEQSA